MKQHYFIYLILTLLFANSCELEDYKEVDSDFKRMIYLVQNGTVNGVLTKEIAADSVFNGQLSVYCSGVTLPDKDVSVQLMLDTDKLSTFNASQASAGETVYESLPAGALTLPETVLIPKGKEKGILPFRIDPSGLQPGTSYMFVVTIRAVSEYEINTRLGSLYYSVKLK